MVTVTSGQELTEAERKRLERFERAKANRRGRKAPTVMPARLARTSAFAPRKKGLITDSGFQRLYVVRPHTVVEVRGRELGSQHRDALYALFRMRAKRTEMAPQAGARPLPYYHTETTWRALLSATGRTAHVNNLGTMLRVFEELRSVSFRFYQGDYAQYEAASQGGRLAAAGYSDNLLGRIEWDGVTLDSRVKVAYGEWVRDMFESRTLASIDGETYFKLRSDYAKAFWPFLDSQPDYTWIPVETLAELAGRDYKGETTRQRLKFREECRQAFDDMVNAGGLSSWTCEETGSGRAKSYRYRYVHALPKQGSLALGSAEPEREEQGAEG
ncbi:hypothetical protein HMPREF9946_03965 [Acetobacteraceae bacterium AT-5844]|nr:hypothetical protein HMPREF9946_03965 [Acetobacteraceae bacterium AT-5844]